MIDAIIGKTRSGKSYEAARYHILEAVKSGRMVVTNLSINIDFMCSLLGESSRELIVVVEQDFSNFSGKATDYNFSQPEHFTKYEWRDANNKGPLFVIDEAHFVFSTECTKEILKYLAMHGHYGHDILMLTQDSSQLHRTIRKMINISIRTIKLSIVGDDKSYKRKVYSGVSTRNSDFFSEETRHYDSQYFNLYKSHTLSSDSVKEEKINDIKGGGFIQGKNKIIALCFLGLFLTIFALKGLFTSTDSEINKIDKKTIVKPKIDVKPKIKEPIYSDDNYHPYEKIELHVVGNMSIRGNGRLVELVQFDASKSDNVLFQLDSVDLLKAGYDIEVYSDCAVKISHNLYSEIIVCDSPDRSDFNSDSSVAQVFD